MDVSNVEHTGVCVLQSRIAIAAECSPVVLQFRGLFDWCWCWCYYCHKAHCNHHSFARILLTTTFTPILFLSRLKSYLRS